MKNTFKFILSAALVIPAFARAEDDRLAKLENRLAELEAQQSLNIFTFGGLLETRYDSLKANNTTYAGATALDSNVDYLRLRASLDVNANVSKNIKVYSRFTSSKYSNLFYTTNSGQGGFAISNPTTNTDLSVAKSESGAQVYLEKFYADLTVPDTGFVFSFGRLPTADGPPFHQQNGRPRTGTYPGLLYNAELDGLALTYNTQVGDGTLSARLVHTPYTILGSSNRLKAGNSIISNPSAGGVQIKTMQDLDTAMLEYNTSKLSFADSANVILQAYQFGTKVGGEEFLYIDNTLGSSANRVAGSGVADIGINAYAIYLGLDNIMKSNIDASITYLASNLENKSVMTVAGSAIGYGSTTTGTKTDSSILTTIRYRVNGKTWIGGEYLNGGKNVFVYDSNSDNVSGFYNTTGTASNVFVYTKLSSELLLRVGKLRQDYKATPFSFGAQTDSDRTIDTYYAQLRLDF